MSYSVMTQTLMVDKKKHASVIIEKDGCNYLAKERRYGGLICNGQDKESVLSHLKSISDDELYLCHFCKGTGLRLFENCQHCDGTGKLLTYFIAE